MRVLIVGVGAVGLGLASFLQRGGAQVSLLARPETAEALRRNGLQREGLFGSVHLPSEAFELVASLSSIDAASVDWVLVCTKSFASADVAHQLMRWCPKGPMPRLVLCQNGWGNAEQFTVVGFAAERVFNARLITGYQRTLPNRVAITVHADAIRLGSLFGVDPAGLQPLRDAIDRGGMPCELTEDIAGYIWAKLLYNCALNGLGALFDVPYGPLGESEHGRQIMRALVQEIYAVMGAAGYRTQWPDAESYLEALFETLIPRTAGHYPSTWQDLQAGKPTEIDALNGAIVELAAQHGLSAPVNATVQQAVHFLAQRRAHP